KTCHVANPLTAGNCGCSTCTDLGFDCGTTDNGCGTSITCGTCPGGKFCNIAAGQTAGNCTQGCMATSDCPDPGVECQSPRCIAGVCQNVNAPDGIQCNVGGGVVGTSTNGVCFQCFTDADCTGALSHCDQNTHRCTQPPSCTDNIQDGSESDVDCGGPNCP